MNNKALLTLLALLGWIGLCSYWYCNTACNTSTNAETAPVVDNSSNNTAVVQFNANNYMPILSGQWLAYRDSLLQLIQSSKRIEITGYYGATETNTTSFENLGIARADTLKKLLLAQNPILNPSRFLLRSAVSKDLPGTAASFVASNFMIRDTIATPTNAGGVVIQDENNIIVYFPTGSSAKEANKAVDEGLAKIAEKMKTSGQSAQVTGHTDNKGDYTKNLALSKERAEFVKSILVAHGVDASKIAPDGKADKEPVGDNNTDAGRRQNRRVEIKLN